MKKLLKILFLITILLVPLKGHSQQEPKTKHSGDATDDIRAKMQEMNLDFSEDLSSMEATAWINSKIIVDCLNTKGELLRFEQYNNTPAKIGDVDFYNAQGLHTKILRMWLTEETYYDPQTGEYNYDKGTKATEWDEFSRMTDAFLANFSGRGLTGMWGLNPEECMPILKKILVDMKTRWPKLVYIEVTNEPDYSNILTSETYYRVYKTFYQAVNEANKELQAEMPLQVGGPATAQFDLVWLKAFLDAYRDDSSTDKRIDFIAYHGYFMKPENVYHFYKENPSAVKDQRAMLDQELRTRGLSTDIPAFITELGIYPGPLFDDYSSMRNDHFRQACGMMSLYYWYQESGKTYPFNWVIRHHLEGRKDQLVTRDEFGNLLEGVSGKFTPYGNALVMQSKMKKTRISTTSTTSINEGKGLYTHASLDTSGVSVMVWNFQAKKTDGYNTEINVVNLPNSFKGKNIRVKKYVIDTQTSNYHTDFDDCNLQMVDESVVSQNGSFDVSIRVEPNTLQLIILEPDKKVSILE